MSVERYSRIILYVLLSVAFNIYADAHLLNAYEMAIGKWDLRIHQRDLPEWYSSILFPPNPLAFKDTSSLGGKDDATVEKKRRKACSPPWKRGALVCTLCLDADGTFSLVPHAVSSANHHSVNGSRPTTMSVDDEERALLPHMSGNRRLPAQGEWFLRPNPYCVTDCQYDTLHLRTYPRVKQIMSVEERYAFFEIRCKLWGRYGMKSIRQLVGHEHGRCKGRISHGTIVLRRRESRDDIDLRKTKYFVPFWRRRIVCGTFTARSNDNHVYQRKPRGRITLKPNPNDELLFDDEVDMNE